jgi:hypothetical protein
MTRAIDSKDRLRPGWIAAVACLIAACDRGAPSSGIGAGEAAHQATAQTAEPPQDAQALQAKLVEAQAQVEALRRRQRENESSLAETRAQLEASEARRVEREREWLEYSSLLAKVKPAHLPGGQLFAVDLPAGAAASAATQAAEPRPPIDPAVAARSVQIAAALRTLFTLEQIRGLDLLECGTLEGNAIGPVVFRMLDGQGRLAGSLYANHLRMEASRMAHTLTLVLEDGYETRAGAKLPFEVDTARTPATSTRRIVLEAVDPTSWANEFHELFGERGLDLSGDDGLWDLAVLRQRLNDLLKSQSAGGTYRLRALGGVQDACLLEVHLERLDPKGAVERRLFADRMRIARAQGGVEITLEDGVQIRGEDERAPFLDGRYRILLPAADGEAWMRAGVPGLSPPPNADVQRARDGAGAH